MKFRYRLKIDGALRDIAIEEILSLASAYKVKFSMSKNGNKLLIESDVPLNALFLRTALIVDAEQIVENDPYLVDWYYVFSYNSKIESGIPLTYKIEKTKSIDTKILSEINNSIRKSIKNAKVSLTDPQITLRIHRLSIDKGYEISLKIPTGREIAQKREPCYRPYAPSAAMSSILSRALVNLACLKSAQVFLDPFCGTGSLTIEAALMGIFSIGIDINERLISIAKMLKELFKAIAQFMVGDARNIKLEDNSVDGIATDPPYGISSSTYGADIWDLYETFLGEACRVVKKGGKIVVCHTKKVDIRELGDRVGLKFKRTYYMQVHSKLVRCITIFST